MNARQALDRLQSLGTAQTRKTYGRHGVTGPMFGVRHGDLGKLVREIKVDHDLALELWGSGNHDARILATMIADRDRLDAKVLGRWIAGVDDHVLSSALAGLAAGSPAGRVVLRKWMARRSEWPAATGWMGLASALRDGGEVPPAEGRRLLAEIERRIHSSPNRVKYSMNTAMIALGAYVPGLEDHAVRVAGRIGAVEVDHGLTHCQTPLAGPYIRKAAAAHRAKLARASAGARRKAPAGGARRRKAATRRPAGGTARKK